MIAELHIETALRDGITFLKKAFNTQPFKVANITEDKKSSLLKLMLMSSSPGILDGDEYSINIEVAAESSLQLQTQSYQRLYNMQNGASQKMELHVKKGGAFYYLPHPSVPHRSSSFTAKNSIYLSDHCSLLWGEVITCGRKESGESFLFSKFHNITEIFINGKLVIKENILIQPSRVDVSLIGQLEGYTHQATMIFLDEEVDTKKLSALITEHLSTEADIEFGVTAAPCSGIILRLLGYKAEQLFDILQLVANNFIIQKKYSHVG